MKKTIFSCAAVLLMGAAAVLGNKAFNPQTALSPIQLEITEALGGVEHIGDKYFIYDNISCATSAQEYRVDCSYVNCTDCASQAGKATNESTCTNLRPIPGV